VLSNALKTQSRVNPDEIFGLVAPINIEGNCIDYTNVEEIFPQRPYRARSSSGDWTDQDRLTEKEVVAYNERMGYHPLTLDKDRSSGMMASRDRR